MINMKKEKSATLGLVICFVALIAIVGAVALSNYEKKPEGQLAKTEENAKDEDPKKDELSHITQGDKVQAEIVTPSIPIVNAPVEPKELHFSDSSVLTWPIDGNVLMNYSMDQTIYFSTLDQYKYNPALVIEGQVGQDVRAAHECKVVHIQKTAETGTTITVDMGDGYQAIYGQLGEVLVTEGERLAEGDLIGYLAEPTKYYSVEGCNLYFKLLKDGEPVNPLNYLES